MSEIDILLRILLFCLHFATDRHPNNGVSVGKTKGISKIQANTDTSAKKRKSCFSRMNAFDIVASTLPLEGDFLHRGGTVEKEFCTTAMFKVCWP